MYKIETTSKVSQKLTRKINLGRQGARAELSAQENDPPSPNTSPQYTTPTKERIATAAPLQRHHKAPAPIPERENQ